MRVAEYEAGPYKGFADDIIKGFASIVPPEADVSAVAEAIVKGLDTPFGKRPFRVHVDPAQDGAEISSCRLHKQAAGALFWPKDLSLVSCVLLLLKTHALHLRPCYRSP